MGEAGGANRRGVDGGVVSWRQVGEVWLTLGWRATALGKGRGLRA